jgi:hypothetical protein
MRPHPFPNPKSHRANSSLEKGQRQKQVRVRLLEIETEIAENIVQTKILSLGVAGLIFTAAAGQALACAVLPDFIADTFSPAECATDAVYSIEAANLDIRGTAITISAEGLASTAGWKNTNLKLESVSEDQTTITYRFVGCPPEFGADVITPVSAQTQFIGDISALRHVVIKAKTNLQTLNIDEFRNVRPAVQVLGD